MRRPLFDRLIDAATREHTLRDELFLTLHCLVLGTITGALACLLVGAVR